MYGIGKRSSFVLDSKAKLILSKWIERELSQKSLVDFSKSLGMSYSRMKLVQLHLVSRFSQKDIDAIARYREQPAEDVKKWLGIGQ